MAGLSARVYDVAPSPFFFLYGFNRLGTYYRGKFEKSLSFNTSNEINLERLTYQSRVLVSVEKTMSILPSLSTFFLSFDVVAVRLFYFLTLEYQFLVLFCFVFPFFLKPRIYRADQF